MTGRKLLLACVGLSGACIAAPLQADTLREALALTYSTNPSLQAARAQQRAVDEEVPINKAQGLPNLTIAGTHIELAKKSGDSFTSPSRQLVIGPDLQVPIYRGAGVKNAIRAAKERVAAGQADLRGSESAIFSQTVAAYMDVLRTQALAQLSANQVDVLQVNLEATSDRFEIGDLTRTDVAQSQSRLALAQGNLRSAMANLTSARETYLQLVGKVPENLEAPPPLPGLPETVDKAVVTALEHNPDLIAAKERAQAASFDTKASGAGRLPAITGFANYDYTDFYGTLSGVGQNLKQSETTADFGIRLSIPLFQGGATAARKRQASARETAAMERMIAAERTIIAQTRSAYASWQASTAVIESSEAAVAAAQLSLEGVRAENSIGNRTILDVLNAEQELLSARAQLVTAKRNAYVAGFALLAAMGKAEARDLNLDTNGPLYDPATNYKRVRSNIWDWGGAGSAAPQSTRTVDIPAPNAAIGPPDE